MKLSHYELYDLINRPGPLWLANADLSDANLRGIKLRGVILSGANLSGADLGKVTYTGSTIWPDDFDLQAAEAILVS